MHCKLAPAAQKEGRGPSCVNLCCASGTLALEAKRRLPPHHARGHTARASRALTHELVSRQVGAVLLTAQHASTEKGQTIFYIVAQFVFGCVSHVTCMAACAIAVCLHTLGVSACY